MLTTFYFATNDHRWVICVSLKSFKRSVAGRGESRGRNGGERANPPVCLGKLNATNGSRGRPRGGPGSRRAPRARAPAPRTSDPLFGISQAGIIKFCHSLISFTSHPGFSSELKDELKLLHLKTPKLAQPRYPS